MATSEGNMCPICNVQMQMFTINFKESICLCPTEECLYQLDKPSEMVFVVNPKSQVKVCNGKEPTVVCHTKKTTVTPTAPPKAPLLDTNSCKNSDDSSNSQKISDTGSRTPLFNLPKSMESIIRKIALANDNFSTLIPEEILGSSQGKNQSQKRKIGEAFNELLEKPSTGSASTTVTLLNQLMPGKTNPKPDQTKQVCCLQWPHSDALCWLDVILCLFVNSKMLKACVKRLPAEDTSILKTLFKAYSQAMKLYNHPEKCTLIASKIEQAASVLTKATHRPTAVKAGKPEQQVDPPVTPIAMPIAAAPKKKAFCDNPLSVKVARKAAVKLLVNAREAVWEHLQDRLKCKKGTNDSPLFALLSLEKQEAALREVFSMDYILEFTCKQCAHHSSFSKKKMIPTLEAAADFSMSQMLHIVSCSNCNSKQQCRTLKPQKFGDGILLHFLKGIPFDDLSNLNFTSNLGRYTMAGVVQYNQNPDHFVAWVKHSDRKWMRCDDLDGPVCVVIMGKPAIPKTEIHLVMWEKVKTKTQDSSIAPKDNFQRMGLSLSTTVGKSLPSGVPTPVTTLLSCSVASPVTTGPTTSSLPSTMLLSSVPSPSLATLPGSVSSSPVTLPLTSPQPSTPPITVSHQNFKDLPVPKGGTKVLPVKFENDDKHLNKLKANLAIIKRFKK